MAVAPLGLVAVTGSIRAVVLLCGSPCKNEEHLVECLKKWVRHWLKVPINAVLTLCSGACCVAAVVVVANMVKFLGGSGLEGKVMVVPFPVETTFPTPPLCVEDIDSWK